MGWINTLGIFLKGLFQTLNNPVRNSLKKRRQEIREGVLIEDAKWDQARRKAKGEKKAAKKKSEVIREALIESFQQLLDANEIEHFEAVEVLTLGASHYNEDSLGYQQNSLPPVQFWDNIIPTVRILDKVRNHFQAATIITNGYRNEIYNDLIGGSENSQHKEFRALDFYVKGHEPMVVAKKLKEWRLEGKFTGGIGTYKTFVHLDTRGYNATWEN